MARSFPRFLFSNPQNTKTKGPFIIHLLKPKCICKVYERWSPEYNSSKHIGALHFGRFAMEVIEAWDDEPGLDYSKILVDANDWLKRQLASGEISLLSPFHQTLWDMGFIETLNTQHLNDTSFFEYNHGNTRLLLHIFPDGWELFDGRPTSNKLLSTGNFKIDLKTITELLIEYGRNRV